MHVEVRKSAILIVDDVPANIKVLARALMYDYEVSAAISGEEALQIVAEALPDLILLDIQMPGMNGFTVCERLKANEATKDIIVIFITGENDPDSEIHGLSVGAVDFIVKPINPPVMLSRIKMQLALKKAEMQALQDARSKSQFLALMSHEIRTPLNGIIGFANLLAKQPLSVQGSQFLDIMRKSGKHLLTIVNDILDYSKIESGRVVLEEIPFDVRKIVSDVGDLITLSAEEKGITLSWRCQETVPAVICGDPNRLRQILFNLTSNAVKFTLQGQVDLEVSLVPGRNERIALQFSVRDTGIGISEEGLKSLFKPFVQADVSTTRAFGGTGLGLVICSRLIRLMGGEIQVESEPGKGSNFYFTVHFVNSFLTSEELEDAAKNHDEALKLNKKIRILVVEDVEVNRLYISDLLYSLDIRSFELVCNGLEALEALKINFYDLVLMDCRMPVMDGFDATRALRRFEKETKRPHTPVIALTANVTEEDRLNCLAAGMDGFLTKPIEEQALLSELAHWFGVVLDENDSKESSGSALKEKLTMVSIPGAASPTSPLDESRLAEKAIKMGKERFDRLLRAFFQDLEKNMTVLYDAVNERDAEKISQGAHAMKGCCSVVHAEGIIQLCGEIESKGRRGEIQEITMLFEQLEREYSGLLNVLKNKQNIS
ncbi:MAG: response regulator [Magnetococcales bacterium]|nr:response regulator [Magnetococcales bacterium]